ncbi:hypothetical protein [Herminiimonas contaminans]|uniref:Uncharacterized protein n=1 Tax=Herminiimonas contaminans TaxID=1111140 RepID=A0ABS0EUC2_9BURK|nr:hypothetical protein [Herminiimonas contaminans]MBF8177659.1 hypothetical protein [Herminiimonas contaminans]
MALNCLQIIQTVCRRIGILAPNAAVGSTDPQIIQLLTISEEEGQDQADRYSWQALQTEATFTTVATQVQGALSTIAPNCDYIVNNTIWNRTLRRPVYGPKSEQDWQQSVAMAINGPFNAYRIIGDSINFYPNPVAGQTCAFEYVSRDWVATSTATTSSIWTNDLDTPKISDQLMILGTIWRWKAAKGLDYAEDFSKYERRMADAMGRDGSKPVLSLSGQSMYEIQPVVMVPRGSW